MAEQYDLVIIGAGPGGYEAALCAARQGMKAALIEKEQLGGTCLNRGCIPTKTILHTADLYQELQDSEVFGLTVEGLGYQMAKIQQRKEDVLTQLRGGIDTLLSKAGVTVYYGWGKITGEHQITVEADGTATLLQADYILLAVGAAPVIPPIPGTDLPHVMSSDQLLEQQEVYPRLTIIGGGVIGMEFASIYSALGCQVTVIEALDRILATMDKEIGQNLKMILKKHHVDIHTGAVVQKIVQEEDGSLACHYLEKDKEQIAFSDGILVATGRRACLTDLWQEELTIAVDQRNSRIVVNEHYQTSYPHIYAVGDAIGGIQLAHVATAEGLHAVAHMLGQSSRLDLAVVPCCVYTSPEIATVGLDADGAKKAGMQVIAKKYVMSANGKTVLSLQERGFIKVIAEAESGRLLGAQMMCARATDMISEFATAIVHGLTLEQMASVIRPHPTFSEAITEVCR